jgi:hypothetical protein
MALDTGSCQHGCRVRSSNLLSKVLAKNKYKLHNRILFKSNTAIMMKKKSIQFPTATLASGAMTIKQCDLSKHHEKSSINILLQSIYLKK